MGFTGEVSPDDPGEWNSTAKGYVGITSGNTGTVTVDGGSALASLLCHLGHGSGSAGTVTVTGPGSTWSNEGSLYVGSEGNGTLNVEGGGQVSTAWSMLGRVSGAIGAATVTGGSTWTHSNDLTVGFSGSGTLDIEAGGQVSSMSGCIGAHPGSTGNATVTGGSTWTSSRDLSIGIDGSGALDVTAGGQVSSMSGYVGHNPGSTGTVTVTGVNSTWTNSLNLWIGRKGSGTLTVADGGQVSAETLYAALSALHGNGTIEARGAVIDADLLFDATHGPVQTLAFGVGGALNLNVDGTGSLGAGYKGTGTLRIADGANVASDYGSLGYWSGSTGTATVSGPGSSWTTSRGFAVGDEGDGTLRIEGGGQVSNSLAILGVTSGAVGTATVIGADSTWTNSGSLGVGSKGSGVLRVEGGARVSSASGYVGNAPGAVGTATVTGTGSTWTHTGSFEVGHSGSGTLRVEAGGQVSNHMGYIGTDAGGIGTVTVIGAGSTWTNTAYLEIGRRGSGTLRVEAGGTVTAEGLYSGTYMGHYSGSTGAAVVTGTGSTWTNASTLYVGYADTSTLTVADGGQVTAKCLRVMTALSSVRLSVSGDDMLVLGDADTTGMITNHGTIAFYADAFLAADTYTPICEYADRAITWDGTGSCSALGGTWDGTAMTFAVGPATAVTAGSAEAVTTAERVLITDSAGGEQIGASFGTVAGGTTFSAVLMSAPELDALKGTAGFAGSVLSAWHFTTNLSAGEVLLSADIGADMCNLTIWHYDGADWTPYTPDNLFYSEAGIMAFTVGDFSGYAVAGELIPEPATMGLLGLGLLPLLRRRRR
jgi:T5SS/PEP-CTERM-associated repeat protein